MSPNDGEPFSAFNDRKQLSVAHAPQVCHHCFYGLQQQYTFQITNEAYFTDKVRERELAHKCTAGGNKISTKALEVLPTNLLWVSPDGQDFTHRQHKAELTAAQPLLGSSKRRAENP